MKDSKYQTAIYEAVRDTNLNLAIEATAGSGKSTTLVNAVKYLPYGKRVLFSAFNRHSVEDLKKKLGEKVDCFTLHSLGVRSIYSSYENVKIKEDKQIEFIEPLFMRAKNKREKWSNIYETDRLLSLTRATMTSLAYEEIERLAKDHNLFPEEEVINAVLRAGESFKEYNQRSTSGITIDFQDMIEIPALQKSIRVPQYDCIMVDEAQDCSKLDQLFIERLVKPVKGRLIVCGDKRQAIYSFRGADVNSFEYFTKRPNTIQLPLSISYRCPKKVVEEARTFYTEIEPWEESSDGEVRKGELKEVEKGDMIICRNLRPLIEAFIGLLEQDKKAVIIGKDLTKGLLQLIEYEDDEKPIGELREVTQELKQRLKNKLALKGITEPTNHPRMISLEEKIDVLHALGGKCKDIGDLKNLIERIFSDNDTAPIRLSSVHKAKGKECDNVFFIRKYQGKTLIPSQYAVTKDQLIQEKNLEFVATTRAKKKLIYLEL